jgi:hypothetical protein
MKTNHFDAPGNRRMLALAPVPAGDSSSPVLLLTYYKVGGFRFAPRRLSLVLDNSDPRLSDCALLASDERKEPPHISLSRFLSIALRAKSSGTGLVTACLQKIFSKFLFVFAPMARTLESLPAADSAKADDLRGVRAPRGSVNRVTDQLTRRI